MTRKPAADSARARFATLLSKSLADGLRPATDSGEPWTYAAFAAEVTSSRRNDYVSPRSVSNWCKGASSPAEIEPILRALFGPSNRHADAREILRAAFKAARAEKNGEVIAAAEPHPAGSVWVAGKHQFIKDRTTRQSDEHAAADPLRQQMQAMIRSYSADLAARAKRLENTATWGTMAATAGAFAAITALSPMELLGKLGDAYARLLQLGRFLETDVRVQKDHFCKDEPLDPDIHGLLTDLVLIAAPWLRGFPTVIDWDDAAGQQLTRADIFQPAREFTRIARAKDAITDRDAIEAELLGETADATDFQGQKPVHGRSATPRI